MPLLQKFLAIVLFLLGILMVFGSFPYAEWMMEPELDETARGLVAVGALAGTLLGLVISFVAVLIYRDRR